jgi:8-oxo-dGTP pyrophosphatase MutT (NUDIX family)
VSGASGTGAFAGSGGRAKLTVVMASSRAPVFRWAMPFAADEIRHRILRTVGRPRRILDRADLVCSAVLVPVVLDGPEPQVIFTRRAMTVAKHKGQISFPGGAAEPGDADPVATALREAREEIGLDPAAVEVAGLLDDQITTTGFLITPVVGFLAAARFQPDPVEVDEVFGVPWSVLADPARHDIEEVEWRGMSFRNHRYHVGDKVIWGATGRILARFIAAVERDGDPNTC